MTNAIHFFKEGRHHSFASRCYPVLLLFFLGAFFQGCTDTCETYYTYTQYEPVTMSLAEIRESIQVEAPRQLKNPGKLYIKDHYLFISEAGEGVHIIDNSDKTNPVPKAFIKIPGCYDMAVLGTILYTDSYTDLVSFDISNVNNIREVDRNENIFHNRGNHQYYILEGKGLVVDYTPVLVQSEEPMGCEGAGHYYFAEDRAFNDSPMPVSSGGDVVNHAGKGGSMARFAIQANHLYALDIGSMFIFDLQMPLSPDSVQRMALPWDIETIFPYENDKLFIGTTSGMHILDNSDPKAPIIASSLEHVTACDPVVVENDIAYVTLRTGNACAGNSNQLDVIDVSDIYSPILLKTYPMTNPHGLGIENGTLFICEGDYGLKVYDATDINKIAENLVEHNKEIHAFDVIPFQNILLLIGEDGFYQYDYSDIHNIKLLSHIAVVHE